MRRMVTMAFLVLASEWHAPVLAGATASGSPCEASRLADNKAIVRRAFEQLINQKDLPLFDTLFSPEYVNHRGLAWEPDSTPASRRQEPGKRTAYYDSLFATYPDLRVTIGDMIAEGDRVVVRNTWRGTQRGPYRGLAPTGKPVAYTGIVIFRLENGKIVDRWGVIDRWSVLEQLGDLPRPEKR